VNRRLFLNLTEMPAMDCVKEKWSIAQAPAAETEMPNKRT